MVDTLYVIVGDRHFTFDPLSTYTSSLGAMHFAGYDNPSSSWKRNHEASPIPSAVTTSVSTSPVFSMAHTSNNKDMTSWQLPRCVSPQNEVFSQIHIETNTSNSFTAIVPLNDMSEEDSSSEKEELESYSDDPLELQDDKNPTPKVKKGRG